MSEKDERAPDFESAGVHEVNLAEVPTELGILPLRDTILFPNAILPLAVARESSVALVHDAVRERKVIGGSGRSPTSTRCSSSRMARSGSWSRACSASGCSRSPSTSRS